MPSAIPTFEITSLGDLIDRVEYLYSETAGARWWFRGLADGRWELLPRVWRDHTPEQERYFAHEFRARAGTRHSRCPSFDAYADWLPLMQHYGVPTRLMDWSRSPLVAAFFAVELGMRHRDKSCNADACIWALAPGSLNLDHGMQPLLYTLNAGELHDLLRPAFKAVLPSGRIVAAVPFEADPRIQVQQGVFTVHDCATPLQELPGAPNWLRKFVIPQRAVHHLAQNVETLGFGRADLFPDLDNLALELRSWHRPR